MDGRRLERQELAIGHGYGNELAREPFGIGQLDLAVFVLTMRVNAPIVLIEQFERRQGWGDVTKSEPHIELTPPFVRPKRRVLVGPAVREIVVTHHRAESHYAMKVGRLSHEARSQTPRRRSTKNSPDYGTVFDVAADVARDIYLGFFAFDEPLRKIRQAISPFPVTLLDEAEYVGFDFRSERAQLCAPHDQPAWCHGRIYILDDRPVGPFDLEDEAPMVKKL